jgi:hypothetical protein
LSVITSPPNDIPDTPPTKPAVVAAQSTPKRLIVPPVSANAEVPKVAIVPTAAITIPATRRAILLLSADRHAVF